MTGEERKAEALAKALLKAIYNIEAASDVSSDILDAELELHSRQYSQGVKLATVALLNHWNGE